MKKLIILGAIVILSSCLRLDDLVFVRDDSITEYLFDKYQGDVEIEIPDSYDIPDSLINIVTFPSQMDGESSPKTLYGVFIGDLNVAVPDSVILYCHGQKDHMDYYWTRAKLLANCGWKNRYGVFMFDYRGYGLSEGLPTEEGMYADIKGALDWLASKKINNIFLYGFSLGSAPATYAAAFYKNDYPIRKLILESPFASADFLTQNSTVINTSASYLTDLEISNAEWIKEVDVSFMWMHGMDDDYIAIENGEIIYNNYNGPYKEAHRIKGAKHGKKGVPETMGYDNYLDVVLKFLEK